MRVDADQLDPIFHLFFCRGRIISELVNKLGIYWEYFEGSCKGQGWFGLDKLIYDSKMYF